MYRIESGSTRDLEDTAVFVELLGRLPERFGGELGGFFEDGREIVVSRAPGRLDLMGGIADYSGSLVLELPIASATHVALQRLDGELLEIVSLPASAGDRPRSFSMPLATFLDEGAPVDYRTARLQFIGQSEHHWASYVAGAFLVLMRERGAVFRGGVRILISSDVPEGKGVSSSASLEVAAMEAIAAAFGVEASPREVAFLCQRVENLVAGAPCGVMDQMTAACGETGQLLALLCQPGELKGTVGLPHELAVWGVDSGIRHSVGGAEYGTVRAAAFMGYRMIAEMAGLPWRHSGSGFHVVVDDPKWNGYLANITPEEFERDYAARLPDEMEGAEFLERYAGITDPVTTVIPHRRYPVGQATRHPVLEHDRVTTFARILDTWRGLEQATELGALMYESHAGYSACGLGSSGTDELVALVREAGPAEGLYGAKITGGGSGGTVAILGRRDAGGTIAAVAREYAGRTGQDPLVISGSSPGAGAFGVLRLKSDEQEGR